MLAHHAEVDPEAFRAADPTGFAAWVEREFADEDETGSNSSSSSTARWSPRERGATVAETTTYHEGPVSVPFWTERSGYKRRSLNVRRTL